MLWALLNLFPYFETQIGKSNVASTGTLDNDVHVNHSRVSAQLSCSLRSCGVMSAIISCTAAVMAKQRSKQMPVYSTKSLPASRIFFVSRHSAIFSTRIAFTADTLSAMENCVDTGNLFICDK